MSIYYTCLANKSHTPIPEISLSNCNLSTNDYALIRFTIITQTDQLSNCCMGNMLIYPSKFDQTKQFTLDNNINGNTNFDASGRMIYCTDIVYNNPLQVTCFKRGDKSVVAFDFGVAQVNTIYSINIELLNSGKIDLISSNYFQQNI